jgi:hypothetical protein
MPGQDMLTIKGMVSDSEGQAMPGATVKVSPILGTTTDERGMYQLDIPRQAFALTVSFLGYQSQTREFYKEDLQQLTSQELTLHFQLELDIKTLPTASVSGKRLEKIYENNRQIISDFDLAGEYLLLLLREKRTTYLSLQTEEGLVIDTLHLPFKAFSLHKGCTGAFHVDGNWEAAELSVENDKIYLLKRYPVEEFEKNILPCLAATPDFILYRQHLDKLNQTSYYAVNRYSGESVILKTIQDWKKTEASRLYLTEIIADYYLHVGSDPFYNIIEDGRWNGDLLDLAVNNDLMAKISYYDHIVTKEISTAAFQHEGNWVVFDHQNDSLFYFSTALDKVSSLPISYPSQEGWKEVLYQDEATQRVYARFEKKDQLLFREINPATGTTGDDFSLTNPYYFLKEIKIKDGAAYFIAQDAPTSPYRQVYKQYLVKKGRVEVQP